MYYVYVLKSEDHYRFYVGFTQDVEKRLKEHNNGKTKSTKGVETVGIIFHRRVTHKNRSQGTREILEIWLWKTMDQRKMVS